MIVRYIEDIVGCLDGILYKVYRLRGMLSGYMVPWLWARYIGRTVDDALLYFLQYQDV